MPARAGTVLTAQAGAPFCTEIASLHPYVLARANRDVDALARLSDCRMLPGGLRVEVFRDTPGLGGKVHLLQVRIHDGTAVSDGYLYGNALVVR